MRFKFWTSLLLLLAGLLVGSSLGLSLPLEDEFVFDDEQPSSSSSSNSESVEPPQQHQQQQQQQSHAGDGSKSQHQHQPKSSQRVDNLLGLLDAVAVVGHVFKIHVPDQAFAGDVDYYKARGPNGEGLPHWLHWDGPAAALYGVPSHKDLGHRRIVIKAVGKHGDSAEDSFTIHVEPRKNKHFSHRDKKKRCKEEQERTVFSLLVDAKYDSLKPLAKVNALENLEGFLGLAPRSASIVPEPESGPGSRDSAKSFIVVSKSDVKRRKKRGSIIQWQVGCNGQFWPGELEKLKMIPDQTRDKSLSEVTMLPVLGWRVRSEPNEIARTRREVMMQGSGDGPGGGGRLPDEDDDEEYDEEEEDYDDDYDGNSEGVTQQPPQPQPPKQHSPSRVPALPKPQPPPAQRPPAPELDETEEHPHRHHHGEESVAGIGAGGLDNGEEFVWKNSDVNNEIFNSSTPSTSSPSTTAETMPPPSPSTEEPTTTTSSTTTSTTTTTTTTVEPPTSPSTSSSESTPVSSSHIPVEPESSSTFDESMTPSTSSTTEETFNIDEISSPPSTSSATPEFVNHTQEVVVGGSNGTSDSMTVDGDDDEESELPTDFDEMNELDSDLEENPVTTLPPVGPDATGDVSSSTTTSTTATTASSGVGVDSTAAGEPNSTSILTVNSTADENPESSGPAKETTMTEPTWAAEHNMTDKAYGENLDPFDSINVPVSSSTSTSTTTEPTTTTSTTTPSTTSTTTTMEPTTTTSPAPSSTTPSTTTTTEATTTTQEPSTTPTSTSTTTTTTTTPAPTTTTTTTTQATTTTTERIVYVAPNFPPRVERRLKKIPATQGKLLSYTIPEDTFSDGEDGNTRQLRLKVYEKGAPLKSSYWMQFNEETQEVYGLPIGVYGTHPYEVIATDSRGLTANDRLDISVQHHKQMRAFNHEFHMNLKIEKRDAFPTNVDWEIKVMRNLAQLYGDNDLSYITVTSIDIDHDQALFTWTNDSLARSDVCPYEEIMRLYRNLISNDKTEEPSDALVRVLGPEIRPKRVVYEGLEQCQQMKETQMNHNPVPRNQIDQLNATVGQLFVYKVPEDTFWDEEDGHTGKLRASLLTANRDEIPASDWLQFDSKNQQFYGVPLTEDIGRKTYQLVVKDREGLEATDSLVAEVHPAGPMRHPMEVSMTLNMPYDSFARSASKRREFVEKLQRLYGDRNASSISLLSVNGGSDSVTVSWRNTSLPTRSCPSDEIARLKRVLMNDNNGFTEDLQREFSQQVEFTVLQITVLPMGACQDVKPGVKLGSPPRGSMGVGMGSPPDIPYGGGVPPAAGRPPVDDGSSLGASRDEYLVTYVLPGIIIAAMMTLASLIACILYKKRRSGKMSISEKDDERKSFRNKGIPVIFQDELEDKPEPGNKSPMILKQEKPPLPPPEYHQSRLEDGADIPMLSHDNSEEPYQPPPPFTTARDSNRHNRPKPTPTYRKPPPYVPP